MKLQSSKYKSGEKALSKKEYNKLIAAIDNIEDELLVKMAITTGLRREDLCNVKVSNINLSDGILTFHEQKKGLDRPIYLNPDIVQLITKFLKTQEKRSKLFSFSGRTAYRHLNKWCCVAGIPERPFHALRATCVKFCQQAGWSATEVSKLTGDSIRVIQEHYSTPSDGEMKAAITEKRII